MTVTMTNDSVSVGTVHLTSLIVGTTQAFASISGLVWSGVHDIERLHLNVHMVRNDQDHDSVYIYH